MEHADAVELIELAAAEPDGLERLAAGDTPESVAVAGHLAGCPACVAELARVGRTASVVREVLAELPDPALRERTLAFVREVGRDGSGRDAAAVRSQPRPAPAPAPAPVVAPAPSPVVAQAPRGGRRGRWLALAGIAAALILALGIGFGAARVTTTPDPAAAREIAVLQVTAETMLHLQDLPDTVRIALAPTPAGAGSEGALLFSPSSGELVMVASGLGPLAPGEEYGCWLEADGERTRIGRMYPGGEIQAWAGPVEGLDDLPPDAVFGVSLVPAGGGAGEEQLTGGL